MRYNFVGSGCFVESILNTIHCYLFCFTFIFFPFHCLNINFIHNFQHWKLIYLSSFLPFCSSHFSLSLCLCLCLWLLIFFLYSILVTCSILLYYSSLKMWPWMCACVCCYLLITTMVATAMPTRLRCQH